MINVCALLFGVIIVSLFNVAIGFMAEQKNDVEQGIFGLAVIDAFVIVALVAILLTEKGIMVW